MFYFHPVPDPNLSHAGFYILITGICLITLVYLYDIATNQKDLPIMFLAFLWGLGIVGYNISYSEWERPENKEYRAKFIQFVAEREKHSGPKGQTSYSSHVYCEYELEINKRRVLMDCNSKQSPEYVILYWNKK